MQCSTLISCKQADSKSCYHIKEVPSRVYLLKACNTSIVKLLSVINRRRKRCEEKTGKCEICVKTHETFLVMIVKPIKSSQIM